MPSTYAKNKQHIYNYREKNLDKVRAINAKSKRQKYIFQAIAKIFRDILRDN